MSSQNGTVCNYDPGEYLLERFILIAIFGGLCSLCGIWTNCFLVYIFVRRLNFEEYIFPACLAASDCIICFSYLLLFPVQIYSDLFRSYWAYKAWMAYLRPVFAISHISISISCFMIVAVSLDRYCIEVKRRRRRSLRVSEGDQEKDDLLPVNDVKIKVLAIILLTTFCLFSKGLTFFELDIIQKAECSGQLSEFEARPSIIMGDYFYKNWFSLGFRHLVHIFAPFVLLVWLNWEIVRAMRRDVDLNRNNSISSRIVRGNLRNFRQASKTMIVLISTYLTGNILNLIVTAMEHIDKPFLNRHPSLYTLSTDVVSLLTMLICLIRLPIYYRFNSKIRLAIKMCFTNRLEYQRAMLNLTDGAVDRRSPVMRVKPQLIFSYDNEEEFL